jgi:hypothetical protein
VRRGTSRPAGTASVPAPCNVDLDGQGDGAKKVPLYRESHVQGIVRLGLRKTQRTVPLDTSGGSEPLLPISRGPTVQDRLDHFGGT